MTGVYTRTILLLNKFRALIFYKGATGISQLFISFYLVLNNGTLLWGQYIPFFLFLQAIYFISYYGFEKYAEQAILHDPFHSERTWSDAIKFRLGIAYSLLALTLLANINLYLLMCGGGWVILRLYNESFKIVARLEKQLIQWTFIEWCSAFLPLIWLYLRATNVTPLFILQIYTLSELARFIVLQFQYGRTYKIPFLPRADITQLKESTPFFVNKSIFYVNNRIIPFSGAFLLPFTLLACFHLIVYWIIFGTSLAYFIWTSDYFDFQSLSKENVTMSSLKMTIIGTLISIVWIPFGFYLEKNYLGQGIDPLLMIPCFLLLLNTFTGIPWMAALIKLKEETSLQLIFGINMLLQLCICYFTLKAGETGWCLWTICGLSIAQLVALRILTGKFI